MHERLNVRLAATVLGVVVVLGVSKNPCSTPL